MYQVYDETSQPYLEFIYRKEGKKFFTKNLFQTDAPEILLYDFDLVIGQNATYQNTFGFDVNFVVLNKYTLNIGGVNRIVLEVESNDFFPIQETWIEDIGSNKGFNTRLINGVADYDPITLCFFENQINTFSFIDIPEGCMNSNWIPSCNLINANDEISNQKQDQIITPNPITQYFEVNNTYLGNSFVLFDIAGKLVLQGILTNDQNILNDLKEGVIF